MGVKQDLLKLLNLHYVTNLVLCASFVALRTLPPICTVLFPNLTCELNWSECEILMFLAIIIVFRTRRAGATSLVRYLSSACMYCKMANFVLFMTKDPRMGLVYGVLCVLHLLLLPEPSYSGPEKLVYFRGPTFWDEINKDKSVTWFVAFYAAWSPSCVNFAPVFSELSVEYTLDNLKFGKIDVTRFPDLAKEFYISDSSLSQQLPTVVQFKGGKEYVRVPTVDAKGKLRKFFFTLENIKAAFDLNNLRDECRKKLSSSLSKDKKED